MPRGRVTARSRATAGGGALLDQLEQARATHDDQQRQRLLAKLADHGLPTDPVRISAALVDWSGGSAGPRETAGDELMRLARTLHDLDPSGARAVADAAVHAATAWRALGEQDGFPEDTMRIAHEREQALTEIRDGYLASLTAQAELTGVRTGTGRSLRLRNILGDLLRAHMHRGEDVRAGLVRTWEMLGVPDLAEQARTCAEEDLQRARVISLAAAELEGAQLPCWFTSLTGRSGLPVWLAPWRADQDALTAAAAWFSTDEELNGVWCPRDRLKDSLEDALAWARASTPAIWRMRVRAARRDPGRWQRTHVGDGELTQLTLGVRNPDDLAELHAFFTRRVPADALTYGIGLVEEDAVIGVLSVRATLDDGRPYEIRAHAFLGAVPPSATEQEIRLVAAGMPAADTLPYLADVDVTSYAPYRVGATRPPGAAYPIISDDALFGTEPCRHRSGRWSTTVHSHAAVWECNRCGTQAAAVVPRHRIPDHFEPGGPELAALLDMDDNQRLAQHRAVALLRGEPVPRTLAESRELAPPVPDLDAYLREMFPPSLRTARDLADELFGDEDH